MTRLLRGAAWVTVALLIVLLGIFIWLRGSLPKTSGELRIGGLNAPVDVVRDANAVPHIYADSAEDAYFALGFVHAQDRLWQMDFQRRVGAGRLSEVVGEAALETDKFLRTLGVYRAAERTFDNLNAPTQGALLAYSAGVNSFLETRRGPLPPEFLILGYEPHAWEPADSIVWLKMLSWDLSGNWGDELLRARLLTHLSREQVADLFPPYPGDAPVVLPDFRALYEDLNENLPLADLWATSPKPLPPGTGSNNWVLSGAKSVTGSPLLANDPHLQLQAPSLWYFAHLSAPGLDVTGATLPGLPIAVLGRTDATAWGFTNTGPDTQDLFIERIASDDPDVYETPDGTRAFMRRSEIIKVKGGDDVLLEVRESRHGPIISDVSAAAARVANGATRGEPGERYALAFAWTTLRDDDLSMQAGLALNRTRNWAEFENATRDFHSPQQSIVYADVAGNIGLIAPARVPIRAKGDGLVPVPGWSGEYDWTGFIPFEDLPRAFNPPSGQIMTANHKIVSDDYPYFLTSEWAEPYRAERITTLLGQTSAHSLASFRRIQADQTSLMAREFLRVLLNASFEDQTLRDAQAELLGWDGTMARDGPEPLLFEAWYAEFTRGLYADELGDLFGDYWGFRPLVVRNILQNSPAWCDDVRTEAKETCEAQIVAAFERALSATKERYGNNLDAWRWGEAHYADNDHPVLGDTPLGGLFNITIPNGGGPFTVNAARFGIDGSFEQTAGPGYRALYDLAELDRSQFMHTTGQSGNVFSAHYRDFTRRWRDVDYIVIPTNREEVEQEMIGTLRLEPGAQ